MAIMEEQVPSGKLRTLLAGGGILWYRQPINSNTMGRTEFDNY